MAQSFTLHFNYDVFLSFRGKDTRYNFTRNLYDALCRRGIETFFDDQRLEKGDEISLSLFKTIEESRMFIIVFSENYAFSTWRLDELVKILRCAAQNNQHVWPIFYKVNPSNIRHQRNSYGNAMTEHEERFGKDSEMVRNWRSALTKVANFKGNHFAGYEYESKFIDDIVKKVSIILPPKGLNVGEHIVGLKPHLNKVDEGADGRRIGKLYVSNKEIAKGSNGTVVLEGIYEGRSVAVKRLVRVHHDVASKEIQNLIASDHHPNIVRWYGLEYDQDFIYLALERCSCSLDDLIQIYSDIFENPVFSKDQTSRSMIKGRMDIGKDNMQGLWKTNGYPSPPLLKLMRDMVAGLVHLHELGIIHRDLKPQNVLIIKERSLRAKLSDMGISKRLQVDMSSLGHNATGCGSSGWQAPEQLAPGRQTRAVDLFSLGCVLFFCITSGGHPFGERLERDVNIVRNQKDLSLIKFIPEAEDLISRLLDPNPDQRPKALEVFHHPFFWDSEMRLSFVRDASDRVKMEDRESNSDLLKALEGRAPVALGGKWDEKFEPDFITYISTERYGRYNYDSVRDLLRLMRNKLNHYGEMPPDIQELVGSVPDGFNDYFAARFPRLLIEVYKILFQHCKEEECFRRYFKNVD